MKYRKSFAFFALLLAAANGVAHAHAGHGGAGGHFAGGAHSQFSGGSWTANPGQATHQPGFAPSHPGASHFAPGSHFESGHHHDGVPHHHHEHVFIQGFVAAPLVLPFYDWTPATAFPPPAYISQDNPNPVWYYCDDPKGYYPYVSDCPAGWQTVPADQPPPQ